MCGITGALSSTLNSHEVGIVQEAFMCNQVRGMDSAGVISIYEKNHKGKRTWPVLYNKEAITPTEFLLRAKGIFTVNPDKSTDMSAVICHNRLATVGEVKKENAHPFTFDKVAGVHNGTISHRWSTGPKFGTDSEALYWQINERGVEPVLKELNDGWNNAYALVFWDRRDKTVNFIRNNDRPLSYAIHNGTMFFASEPMMLEWILTRNRISAKPTMFPVHKLHKFFIDSTNPLKEMEIKDLTPPPKTYNYGGYSGSYVNSPTARKSAEDMAPAIGFGYIRILTGRVQKGEKIVWRTLPWIKAGRLQTIYYGEVGNETKKEEKKEEEKSAPANTNQQVIPFQRIRGSVGGKPAMAANSTALELILLNLGLGEQKEVDPHEDTPFQDEIREQHLAEQNAQAETNARQLGKGTGTASVPDRSGVDRTVARGTSQRQGTGSQSRSHALNSTMISHSDTGTDHVKDFLKDYMPKTLMARMKEAGTKSMGLVWDHTKQEYTEVPLGGPPSKYEDKLGLRVFEVYGTSVEARSLEDAFDIWCRFSGLDPKKERQSLGAKGLEIKDVSFTADVVGTDEVKTQDESDFTDCNVEKRSDDDDDRLPTDVVFDLDNNFLTVAELDKVLEDGCVGCGGIPSLDDIEHDEDTVNGYFYKGDLGSVQFKCFALGFGGCACSGKKPSVQTKLN